MRRNPLQNPLLRPHETALILKVLKTLKSAPNSTMAIYRRLQSSQASATTTASTDNFISA